MKYENIKECIDTFQESVQVIDVKELEEFAKDNGIEYMTVENYKKNISKNKKMDFYNYEQK